MAIPRREDQLGGGSTNLHRLVISLIVIGILLGPPLAVNSFSLMHADRTSNVDVVDDPSGPLGLTVYPCVNKNNIDPLVDTQNNFGASLSVTVSLVDGSLGTLHVGSQSGDSVTFNLGAGATDTVSFETTTRGGPWPKNLDFNINATTGGISATASRSSQIDNNCP